MLVDDFNAIQRRVMALKSNTVPQPTVAERVRNLFVRDDGVVDLSMLNQLSTDLDAAGIHTVADVRLLKELSAHHPQLGELAAGLKARADASIASMDEALKEAERLSMAGKLPAELRREILDGYETLGRVVKTAAVFAGARSSREFEILSPTRIRHGARPASTRLAVAEFFLDRGSANVEDVATRKRDLDLAHELLLQLGSDAREDRDRVRQVRLQVNDARSRLKETPMVRSLADLTRHLRHAARQQPKQAWQSLRSLYDRALEARDTQLAEVAWNAMSAVSPGAAALSTAVDRSMQYRTLPDTSLPAGGKKGLDDLTENALAELALDLDDDRRKALELAAGCARFFDIEDALAEDVVEAEVGAAKPIWRKVSYPTQHMNYEFTNRIDELNNFVIAHPQTVLLDLASNRQLVRSYLEKEDPPEKKKKLQTAVRVYVLDASGSMFGARAQFRDAILIGELNSLRVRAKLGIPFDPLYFSFFNDVPTDLSRVDSATEATRFIEKLFGHSPADGQTDITLALISAFDSIRAARGRDPYLARATIVLVTDGEDGVDLELIRKLRHPLQGVDISLSFISLGDENRDLKQLALDQRIEGRRAFYHHVSDAEIELAPSEFDSARKTLMPSHVELTPDALERLLPHLEALEAIARNRTAPVVERADDQFDAFFPAETTKGSAPAEVVNVVNDMLNSIADAASLAPQESRAREAVNLLTHLLTLYEVPIARYLAASGSEPLKQARERVRLLCKPWV